MMRALFEEKGSSFRIEILQDKPVQEFIEAHAAALDSSFRQVKMSDAMRRRLQRSDYIFSGLKTFHELNEAHHALIDENGDRKSFERFLNDVRKIDATYNRNYLRAEYNFAMASAEMAARWEQFMEDGDRYNLQYRTAGDTKVRPEHAALHNVTLPITDSFWDEFMPPNGWNCRCSVVQVRKSKYPATSHDEAMALGEQATGRDTRQMFRFNPGKEQQIFPDYNPYTIRKCRNCDIAKGKMNAAKPFIPEYDMCSACKLVHSCYRDKTKESERQRIEENRKLYDKLSKDKRYKDVEFNPENGGLKATHLGHNEGSDLGFVLEKKLVEMLYNCGHSVILCDEQKKGRDGKILSSLDIILDGVIMDIKSLTKNKKHYGSAIRGKNSQLVRFNHRSDVHEKNETLCLYFDNPSMFAPQKITDGYEYMIKEELKIEKKAGQPREIHIHRIICIINSGKGLEFKTFEFK